MLLQKKIERVYVKKGEIMQINNYQSNYNPNFGAKFINNAKDLAIDTTKVGALFEKLTKDSPNETLALEKRYSFGEPGDIFTLRDNNDNKIAKIACSFTTHSGMNDKPETQASLLNNIFRFMKERAKENKEFNELNTKINDLKEQMKVLVRQEDNFIERRNKNTMRDAQKYDIEISDLKSDDPMFKRIYKSAQDIVRWGK